METNKIYNMDCIEGMKQIESNSIDSIVTDPPYELGFMGKKWDNSGIAYNLEMWKEAYRILKPGGYLLSFGGTRTYHRMASAIEDAGFEIRDMINWTYGSGFPKSLNIGKAIDKLQGNERKILKVRTDGAGNGNSENVMYDAYHKFVATKVFNETKGTSEWEGWGTALKPACEKITMAQKPFNTIPLNNISSYNILWELNLFVKIAEDLLRLNPQELNEDMLNSVLKNVEQKNNILGDLKEVMVILQSNLQMVNTVLNTLLLWKNIWEESWNILNKYTTKIDDEMITELRTLKSLLGQLTFLNIIRLKNNQVSGETLNVYIVENNLIGVYWKLKHIQTISVQENVTSTVKKPNSQINQESICMARKPLSEKSVAENVLKYGTGGINIDESRVETNEVLSIGSNNHSNAQVFNHNQNIKSEQHNLGRFPANFIHDGSPEVLKEFEKAGISKSNDSIRTRLTLGSFGMPNDSTPEYSDSGTPARFFKSCEFELEDAPSFIYQAKASKSERNEGCEELEEKSNELIGQLNNSIRTNGTIRTTPAPKKNSHPTVKPLKLMEYLVKLVTPKGGICLDPFMGSGTTAVACKKNGFKYLGFEKEAEYIKIINARLSVIKQKKLLEE